MRTIKSSEFAAVITAAGQSKRMKLGIKKEYLSLPDHGKSVTVISECLLKFLQTKLFNVLVITVPKKDVSTVNNLIFNDKRIEEELAGRQTKIILTAGADTRQASVFNALTKLEEIKEKYSSKGKQNSVSITNTLI